MFLRVKGFKRTSTEVTTLHSLAFKQLDFRDSNEDGEHGRVTEGKIHWEDARRGRNVGRRKSVGVLLLVVGTIAPTQALAFLQDQGRGVASGAAPVTHNRASICPTLAIGATINHHHHRESTDTPRVGFERKREMEDRQKKKKKKKKKKKTKKTKTKKTKMKKTNEGDDNEYEENERDEKHARRLNLDLLFLISMRRVSPEVVHDDECEALGRLLRYSW
ncbi:hypothetical protein V1478_017035 [Vespula squamosa]|uniref:Uncharacterized protein n=1 Tax=Vespula squamosa TaxID=30214 RepID=A0ABD1ZYR7_VESSQ